MGYRMVKVS